MPDEEQTKFLIAIGNIVREGRRSKGIAQKDLASLSGIHRNHLRRIESGDVNTSAYTLMIVLTVLGVEVDFYDVYKQRLKDTR